MAALVRLCWPSTRWLSGAWSQDRTFLTTTVDGLPDSAVHWAMAAIFGPAEGWPEDVTSLNEVWQRAGGELEESSARLPSWAARFEMLDEIIGAKIPARALRQASFDGRGTKLVAWAEMFG